MTSTEINVTILYFGQARDESGLSEETFSVSTGSSLETLFEVAAGRHPNLRKMKKSTQMALNEELAGWDAQLHDGDVVALLPPVAGG